MAEDMKELLKQTLIIENDQNIPSKDDIKEMKGLDALFACMQRVAGVRDLEKENNRVTFSFLDEGYELSKNEDDEYEYNLTWTTGRHPGSTSMEGLKAMERDIFTIMRRMRNVLPRVAATDDVVVAVDIDNDGYIILQALSICSEH